MYVCMYVGMFKSTNARAQNTNPGACISIADMLQLSQGGALCKALILR